MTLIRSSFIFLTILRLITVGCEDADIEEYCNSETFRPSCTSDEIIVMEEATFGRKKLGRCLESEGSELSQSNMADRKFLGCYADVMPTLEPLCSLKKQCEVRVAEITAEVPCYKYLKCSLEVRYSCVRVIQENRLCNIRLGVNVEHLLVSKATSANCGKPAQPWIVEALPGQKITIKTEAFRHINNNNNNNNSKTFIGFSRATTATGHGVIMEKFSKKKTSVMSETRGQNGGSQEYFTSDSNSIEIYFQDKLAKDQISFLLSIEATGCSDLIPPADAWLKRTENEATIGCYSTRLRWQLKCLGQRWIGVIGNCSYGHVIIHNVETDTENEKPTNQIVIVFMIVVAGLVMCLLIGCLGLVCLKRYYAICKLKGLKQMNALVDNFQPVYDKDRLNKDPSSFGANLGGTLFNGKTLNDSIGNPDNAQYFELDQSIVNKELLN